MNYLTVSEINNQIKAIVEETFLEVSVMGECSRVTHHSSGHIYFSIKDEVSTIKCIMFRSYASKLKFQLKEELKINIKGNISLYVPRGEYQLIVTTVEPHGKGSLALAYEQLKNDLEKLGYFKNKKYIKPYPKKIALITSKSGAAIEDIKQITSQRYPLIKFILYDTLMQGINAKFEIAQSIILAQKSDADIIVISRGGGSMEDLWPFNTREVCSAIYESKIPTVSAIGHEIDFTLSDFTADVRAPTPSSAMEMILPSKKEILLNIISLFEIYDNKKKWILKNKNKQIENLTAMLEHKNIKNSIYKSTQDINKLKESLNILINSKIIQKQLKIKSIDKDQIFNIMQNQLLLKNSIKNGIENNFINISKVLINKKILEIQNLYRLFKLQKENSKIKKGYGQISINGKIKGLNELKINNIFKITNNTTIIEAEVKNIII